MKYICFVLCLYCTVSSCKETTPSSIQPSVVKEIMTTPVVATEIETKVDTVESADVEPLISRGMVDDKQVEETKVIAKKDKVKEDLTKTTEPIQKPKPSDTKVSITEPQKKKEAQKETETTTTKSAEKKPVKQEVPKVEKEPETAVPLKIDHKNFGAILAKYVSSNGTVDYAGIKSDVVQLDAYLQELESTTVSALSKKEKLAFWINAYNAYTIKKIVNNYPVKSITDLDGGKPWDAKWIKLDGQTLSLNNIENDIIRPHFGEPRIHFAVNCAAKSCPPLLNKAWTAENLETNFVKQTKAFVNSTKYNEISNSKLSVSKIFEWYAVDFGDLITFLNKYSRTKIDASAAIGYKEYDWALNN